MNSGAMEPGRHASAAPVVLMIAVVVGMAGGAAWGATAEGTLITNVGSVTYGTVTVDCNFSASYCVTAVVLVASPNIQVSKSASPSIECTGATVTFCIWVANVSAYTSAFNVSVYDIIPGISVIPQMAYVQGQLNWITGTAGATVTLGYGQQQPWNAATNTTWGAECPAGQSGLFALRWVVSMVGPGKSALLCWKALIL